MKLKFFIPLLLSILSIDCSTKENNAAQEQAAEADILTSIKLTNLNGEPIDLKQYSGKTIFLNFWATWCRPCIEEMPSIARAKNEFQENDIIFLFASDEASKRIVSFKEKNKFDLNFVKVTNLEDLNIQVLPTTYIINKNGKIKFSESGFRKWNDPANIEIIKQIIENTTNE